jgi:hypothetical protein
MARVVWSLEEDEVFEHLLVDGTDDPKLWLVSLCDNMSPASFIRVLTTLWTIWWARRRAIHENEYQSPLSTHHFINRFIEDLGLMEKMPGAVKPHPRVGAKWIPPSEGFTKINADGAVAKTRNRGSAATVYRDDRGYFQGASVIVFEGVTDPATLEAYMPAERH